MIAPSTSLLLQQAVRAPPQAHTRAGEPVLSCGGHCFLEDSEREEYHVDPKREGQEGGVHVAQITINSYQPCPKAIFSLKLILHKPQSAHTLSKDSTMPTASPTTSLRPQPQSPPGHLPTPLCPRTCPYPQDPLSEG